METFNDICIGRCFIIPENRRAFRWTRKQVDELLADLEKVPDTACYMGPLLVSKTDRASFVDDSLRYTVEYALEDGQQRMMIFFVVLFQIRNQLRENFAPLIDVAELERVLFYEQNGQQLRLNFCNLKLKASFENWMTQSTNHSCESGRGVETFESMIGIIQRKMLIQKRAELLRWKNRIMYQSKFVWIDLEKEGFSRPLVLYTYGSRGLIDQ